MAISLPPSTTSLPPTLLLLSYQTTIRTSQAYRSPPNSIERNKSVCGCLCVCSVVFWLLASAGETEWGENVEETVNERAIGFCIFASKTQQRKRGFLFWIFFSFYLYIYLFGFPWSVGTGMVVYWDLRFSIPTFLWCACGHNANFELRSPSQLTHQHHTRTDCVMLFCKNYILSSSSKFSFRSL